MLEKRAATNGTPLADARALKGDERRHELGRAEDRYAGGK
jgi:hypothetical protein